MITNKAKLAQILSNGGRIELAQISKRLDRIVEMWIGYKSVVIENEYLIGRF